jgi:antitoxin PrlF
MIVGRLTSKSQTTVPRAVRAALDLAPGDDLMWDIEGDRVVVSRAPLSRLTENPFALFDEWGDELDSAYDNL